LLFLVLVADPAAEARDQRADLPRKNQKRPGGHGKDRRQSLEQDAACIGINIHVIPFNCGKLEAYFTLFDNHGKVTDRDGMQWIIRGFLLNNDQERQMSRIYKLPLVLEPQTEGGYTVTCPLLPELITEGETVQDALQNANDALAAIVEASKELKRPLPSVPTAN
jgi:antitoxin HicB